MLVDTPRGQARVTWDLAVGRQRALLVLGHGAGGSITAPDLAVLAAQAPRHGISVARVEQPYRVLGRRSPPPAGHLDDAWLAVLAALRLEQPGPVVTGGRSSGARVAARTGAATGAVGVLALAFPLVVPGGRSRQGELDAVGLPVLVVQGERDPYGVPAPAPGRTVQVIAGGDHGLRRGLAEIAAVCLVWLEDLLAAGPVPGTAEPGQRPPGQKPPGQKPPGQKE